MTMPDERSRPFSSAGEVLRENADQDDAADDASLIDLLLQPVVPWWLHYRGRWARVASIGSHPSRQSSPNRLRVVGPTPVN
jgi:hypothetical protein